MSKQFASLSKGSVFQLGDAEENGLQAIITDIVRDEDEGTPYYSVKIGLAQQLANAGLQFIVLPTSTAIHYRITANGQTTTPPPILIAQPPIPWPPIAPATEPISAFFVGRYPPGALYYVQIVQIDVPGATFREYNSLSFSVTTPPLPTPN